MHKPTITIVGRGIAALCIAREARLHGFPTVVVGKRARPGTATTAAVGVASLKGNVQANAPLFAAKMAGQAMLRGWLEAVGIPYLDGIVEPFFSPTRYAAIRSRVFHRMFTGAHRVEVLGAKAFAELAPFCPAAGGFLYPDDLWFDPRTALDSLESFARMNDVILRDSLVTAIRRTTDDDRESLELMTEDGPIRAEKVVLATGIFANEVLAASGIPDLKQEGVAGETLVGDAPSSAGVALNAGKVNFVAFSGRFFYGSSSRNLPADPTPTPPSLFAAELGDKLGITWGQSASSSVFSGVRGRFRDQSPAFGPLFWTPFGQNLWVALGFHKSGLQLAPLFARDLVRQLAGHPPSPALVPFAASRLR